MRVDQALSHAHVGGQNSPHYSPGGDKHDQEPPDHPHEVKDIKLWSAAAPKPERGVSVIEMFQLLTIYNLPMRQLWLLTLLLVAVPSVTQTAPTPDAIIAQENAFWKAYGDGNATDLSMLLLPEFVNVEAEIWNRDQVLAFIRKFHERCTLAPVRLVDPDVIFLTPDIATLVYHATETPTCGTRTLSGETNISTVWFRRGGRWQMHLHTEYAVPPK